MTLSEPRPILAFDAATPPSSVAVIAGETLLSEVTGPFGKRTDAWIVGAARSVLVEAGVRLPELRAIVATVGPGTFTGIRVGLATALGLGRGAGIEVAGVDTLQALVATARHGRTGAPPLLALVDARRAQIYAALAPAGQPSTTAGPELTTADEITRRLEADPELRTVGPGVEAAGATAIARRLDGPEGTPMPTAAAGAAWHIAALLEADRAADLPPARPLYVRAPDAVPGVNPLRRRRTR